MFLGPLQGCGPGSSSERTRTAITAALSKKLKDLMGDFQNLRARLQQEYRWAALLCAALRGSSMVWAGSRVQVRKAARPSWQQTGSDSWILYCALADGLGYTESQAHNRLSTCCACLRQVHRMVDPAGLRASTWKLL